LDGQKVLLNENILVIADSKKALAMAGIMGGEESAVGTNTVDIFLESAFFTPLTLSGIARRYTLTSDASHRFERGVDFNLPDLALERATELIQNLAGGQAGPLTQVIEEAYLPKRPSITLDTTKVQRLIGVSIPIKTMQTILQGLGMTVDNPSPSLFSVQIPSYRFDLGEEVDLIEEIVRIYGYDNIQAQPAQALIQRGSLSDNEAIIAKITPWFSARGYHETISYSFVDRLLQETLYPQKEALTLVNPISSELSQMRVGMWPGLIASMVHNLHRQQQAVRLFEIGVVFDTIQGQCSERACIAGLVTGEHGGLNWSETKRYFDFYDVKGDLEALFDMLLLDDIQFENQNHPALHPGQSARIMLGAQEAGWIGVLHPKFMDALDFSHEVIVFELNLQTLMQVEPVRYLSLSKYPRIRRDLSFLVDTDLSYADIKATVEKVVPESWLKGVAIFDVYMGTGVPHGKKSIALAITLQDPARTLVDDEINLLMRAIITELEHEFSITMRN
jgi:phenylalanyl-tRNA synthetase beta chain